MKLNIFVLQLLVGLIFLFSAACSKNSSGNEPAPAVDKSDAWPIFGKNAKGSINGYEWNFRKGRAYVLHRHGLDYLLIQLWNEDIANPCAEKVGSTLQARLTAPKSADHWVIAPDDPFNANLSILFSDLSRHPSPRDSMRADQGRIAFYQIAADAVYGYFQASYASADTGLTDVEGDFRIPLCPAEADTKDSDMSDPAAGPVD